MISGLSNNLNTSNFEITIGNGSNKKLKIFYNNIQSLRNKQPELETIANPRCFDLFCLAKHWLQQYEMDATALGDCLPVPSFCRRAYGHGGVAIFAKPSLNVSDLNFNKLSVEKYYEVWKTRVLHLIEPSILEFSTERPWCAGKVYCIYKRSRF